MASSLKYTEEHFNYLKVCLIAIDELTEVLLKKIFKRERDNRYKATLGQWKDEPENGREFWNGLLERRIVSKWKQEHPSLENYKKWKQS